MTRKYAIGEILIFQKARHEPERNGMECLVMQYRDVSVDPVAMGYEHGTFYGIEFEDGARRSALEYQLRRRDEPPPVDGIERDARLTGEVSA
ncbi:hypothetical protein LA345_38810 (plasmid) [Burkholderia vietnamiensis]|uniref:DUF4926 domain-containing protein n=1 Tax=Burkholderia vietnamiensis (strain G4 / LMG 22486) TaxID=269482 RepID=A4JWC3_BURVG|nr:hypothetical protein Bcep1808_7706 [Burkholderia vietnamiensis G4]MCB4349750.1 hypothetical protein [Burkholderia vietnamiensis]